MKRNFAVILFPIIFGIWLSFCYVNPYSDTILLSELIFQLSGSRGKFALNLSLHELLGFLMRLLPVISFEALAGTTLYQYYCTASVYIFCRLPNRVRWYSKQIGFIGLSAVLYQIFLLGSTIAASAFRCHIVVDNIGVCVSVYHLLVYSIWTVIMALCINLLAIYTDSGVAFVVITGGQVVLVCLLLLSMIFCDNIKLQSIFLRVNPISCLILGWHRFRFWDILLEQLPPCDGLYFVDSFLYVVFSCFLVFVVGAVIIKHHDLLVSNTSSREE